MSQERAVNAKKQFNFPAFMLWNKQPSSIQGSEGMVDPQIRRIKPATQADLEAFRALMKSCPRPRNNAMMEDYTDRMDRQITAREFRSNYTYGTPTFIEGCMKTLGHTKERKTCIWSTDTSSWMCKSSGIMWVAVHGIDSICVVTRDEKLDKTRVGDLLKNSAEMYVFHHFRKTVISEIEDLADPSHPVHELFGLDASIRKPFGVVSVTDDSDKVHAECIHEQASSSANIYEEKAIKFLQKKMKSDSDFTYDKTVKTAISAFRRLFHKKFKAQEIRVCTWRVDDIALDLPWFKVAKYL